MAKILLDWVLKRKNIIKKNIDILKKLVAP